MAKYFILNKKYLCNLVLVNALGSIKKFKTKARTAAICTYNVVILADQIDI